MNRFSYYLLIEEQNKNITDQKNAKEDLTLIVTNLAYKIIANFYMKVHKPKRPLKTFRNEEDAIEWLQTITI